MNPNPLRAAIDRQLVDLATTLFQVREMAAGEDVPVPTLARMLTELEDVGEALARTAERLEAFDSEAPETVR